MDEALPGLSSAVGTTDRVRDASAEAREAVSRAAMLVARAEMLTREAAVLREVVIADRAEAAELTAARSRFQTAVSRYAASLRSEGEPPERVLGRLQDERRYRSEVVVDQRGVHARALRDGAGPHAVDADLGHQRDRRPENPLARAGRLVADRDCTRLSHMTKSYDQQLPRVNQFL